MWSKIDDQFYLRPKNALIDRDGQDLYLAGLVFSSGQLTDGVIPVGKLGLLALWAKLPDVANVLAIAKQLVEANYWHLLEDGSYVIHDFLDYNPSRAEVEALREARSEAGRRGGQKTASKRASKSQAIAMASDQAKLQQSSTPSPYPYPLKEVVVVNGETPKIPVGDYAIRVWNKITGMFTIPAKDIDKVLPALEALYYQHGKDEAKLIEFLKPYYQSWISRRAANGLPYSKTNCTWLYDWAVAGEIPEPSVGRPAAAKPAKETKQDKSIAALQRAMDKARAENGD